MPTELVSTGAEDGSIAAIDLVPHRLGQRVCGPLHVHTGGVVQLQAPPAVPAVPWDACVLSVGTDCAVCIVSILSPSVMRIFTGRSVFSPPITRLNL